MKELESYKTELTGHGRHGGRMMCVMRDRLPTRGEHALCEGLRRVKVV